MPFFVLPYLDPTHKAWLISAELRIRRGNAETANFAMTEGRSRVLAACAFTAVTEGSPKRIQGQHHLADPSTNACPALHSYFMFYKILPKKCFSSVVCFFVLFTVLPMILFLLILNCADKLVASPHQIQTFILLSVFIWLKSWSSVDPFPPSFFPSFHLWLLHFLHPADFLCTSNLWCILNRCGCNLVDGLHLQFSLLSQLFSSQFSCLLSSF